MDFPYFIASLKFKLKISNTWDTGEVWNVPFNGFVSILLYDHRLLFRHLTDPHSILATSLAARCREIILIKVIKSVLILTWRCMLLCRLQQIHPPPSAPRCSPATNARLRSSLKGKEKVTSRSQQISCWCCAKTLLLFPRMSPALW